MGFALFLFVIGSMSESNTNLFLRNFLDKFQPLRFSEVFRITKQ
jgi:hypothetical protein